MTADKRQIPTVVDSEHILSYNTPKDDYQYAKPKYPIVLCHGFSGFDHFLEIPVFNPPPLTDTFKGLLYNRFSTPDSEVITPKVSEKSNKLSPSQLHEDKITEKMGIDNKSIAERGKYLIEYWNGIKTILEDHGCTVLVAKVPPFSSIENRASMLDKFIRKSIPQIRHRHHVPKDEPVKLNLVAHSMGGLDCRYLIHQLQNDRDHIESDEIDPRGYQIMSLTTISTPHRGTSAADFALRYTPATIIKNNFPSIFQLSTDYALQFNDAIPNDPNVKYFSYGAAMHPNPASMFLVTWKIINDKEGPNDGMVSIQSCKWGQFKGYLDDVDHADLINWMGIIKKTKIAFGIPNFNPQYFYLDVADNLAKNGL